MSQKLRRPSNVQLPIPTYSSKDEIAVRQKLRATMEAKVSHALVSFDIHIVDPMEKLIPLVMEAN